MMMRPTLIHNTSTVRGITARHDTGIYTGVLFGFGEISANGTMVRPGAKIYASGDAILLEHNYPEATTFFPVGRVKRYYIENDRLLIDFTIDAPEGKEAIESGKKFLSVSWFSDDYELKRTPSAYIAEFNSITIYEVSLVEYPAYNTCMADAGAPLPCMASNSGGCKCGCGVNKPQSVSLSGMIAKHQEVTREAFDALVERVQQLSDALTTLTDEFKALKQKVEADPVEDLAAQVEQAKREITDIVATLNNMEGTMSGLGAVVEKLISVTERSQKTLPNLLRK
jgi:hypothetical protein